MNLTDLPARDLLTAFLLEQIPQQPAERAITLYYALARETDDTDLKVECTKHATELEGAVRREHQTMANFLRRAARKELL